MMSRRAFLSTVLAGAGATACRPMAALVSTPTPLALPTAEAAATPLAVQPPTVPHADAARRLRGQTISIASLTMRPKVFLDISNALVSRFELETGIRTPVLPHLLSDSFHCYL